MARLVCALCMYAPLDEHGDAQDGGVAQPAVTVLGGYAVCDAHLSVASSGDPLVGAVLRFRKEATL